MLSLPIITTHWQLSNLKLLGGATNQQLVLNQPSNHQLHSHNFDSNLSLLSNTKGGRQC